MEDRDLNEILLFLKWSWKNLLPTTDWTYGLCDTVEVEEEDEDSLLTTGESSHPQAGWLICSIFDMTKKGVPIW